MLTETLSVTRLTVVHPIRTTLSEARIRFRLTVERTVDTSPSKQPKAIYSLSFATEHLSDALEVHSDCRHLHLGTSRDSLTGQVFDLLLGGESEASVIRTVLGELQQQAVEGEFPYETRRVLLALWAGIDTTPVTA